MLWMSMRDRDHGGGLALAYAMSTALQQAVLGALVPKSAGGACCGVSSAAAASHGELCCECICNSSDVAELCSVPALRWGVQPVIGGAWLGTEPATACSHVPAIN